MIVYMPPKRLDEAEKTENLPMIVCMPQKRPDEPQKTENLTHRSQSHKNNTYIQYI